MWLPLSRKLSQPLGCWPPLNPLLTPAHTEHSRGHPQPRWVLPPCPAPHHAQSKILTQDRAYVFFLCLYCMQYPIGLRDGNYLLLSISRRWIFFFRLKLRACFPGPFPCPRRTDRAPSCSTPPPTQGSRLSSGFCPCCKASYRCGLLPLQLDDGKGSFSLYVSNGIVPSLAGTLGDSQK